MGVQSAICTVALERSKTQHFSWKCWVTAPNLRIIQNLRSIGHYLALKGLQLNDAAKLRLINLGLTLGVIERLTLFATEGTE